MTGMSRSKELGGELSPSSMVYMGQLIGDASSQNVISWAKDHKNKKWSLAFIINKIQISPQSLTFFPLILVRKQM